MFCPTALALCSPARTLASSVVSAEASCVFEYVRALWRTCTSFVQPWPAAPERDASLSVTLVTSCSRGSRVNPQEGGEREGGRVREGEGE